MEAAEKAPHLDSAHIDMSKDGIGKNKHGDALAELEAREARKADATRAQAQRAAERKAEKQSKQSSQSDVAEEARRRQQQRIFDATEATDVRAMQKKKLSRVEKYFHSMQENKQDNHTPTHPSAPHTYPYTPPNTHSASPTEQPISAHARQERTSRSPRGSNPTSTPPSGNASSQRATASPTTHTPAHPFTPNKNKVFPSRPSTPYTTHASVHDRHGSRSRSPQESEPGGTRTTSTSHASESRYTGSKIYSGAKSVRTASGRNDSGSAPDPLYHGSHGNSGNTRATSGSRQRWTRNTSVGRSGNPTSNTSASTGSGFGKSRNGASGESSSGRSHGSRSGASPSPHSSASAFDRTRARLAKMQQIERITAKPLHIAGSVGGGAVQITRSIVFRKLQETDNDTVKGISYATRYTKQAVAISRAAVTSSPQASFGKIARNPIGLNARQDKLDRMLYQKLTKNGKLLSGSELAKQANIAVRDIERKLEKRIGTELLHASDHQLKSMASKLSLRGKAVKAEIKRLEVKGARLSASERKKLIELKKQTKEIGKNIATIKNAERAKADLAHLRRRASDMAKRTQIRRAPKRILKQTARMGAERALMANEDTQGLAYALRYATNPTVQRITRGVTRTGARVVVGTGKFAGKTVLRVIGQEDLPMRISRALQRGKRAIKKTIRTGARAVGRTISNLVPTPIKTATGTIVKVARKFASIPAGIRNRFYRAQSKLLQNKMSLAIRRTSARIGNALRTVFSFVKQGLAKIALVGGGLLAMIVLVVVIASAMSGAASAVILSPDTSGDKIDLSRYARVLYACSSQFSAQIEQTHDRYKDSKLDTEISVSYVGSLDNTREIISMLAVRFEQNMDISQNSDIEPYLSALYRSSHAISVNEHAYECSGCKTKQQVVIKVDPITGENKFVKETVPYCPGHLKVSITISAYTFPRIFDCDTYTSQSDDWQGWTEDKQEWVKLIYEQDWKELYTGLGSLQAISPSVAITPADERQIWERLLAITDGNAYAAAGAMGNLQAESQLASDRLQGDIPYSDVSKIYTAKVDSGEISRSDFIYNGPNGGGYGLAQWTWWQWKQQLYDLAKAQGKSIGDLSVHLDLLAQLLNGEKISVLNALKASVTVREASDIFLHQFERPADQSTTVEERRASYGQFFYNKYVLAAQIEGNLTEAQKLVCYIATHSADYGIAADAGYCQAWAAMCYYCAGFPVDQSPSAKASGIKYGVSNDFSVIPPGAAIYGRLNQQYGHVGIYVGDGLVYHNIGGVAVDTLENWISYYEAFAWGWQAGTDLTLLD